MFPDPSITPQQQREFENRVVREVGRRHPEVFAEFFRGLSRQGVGLSPRDEGANAISGRNAGRGSRRSQKQQRKSGDPEISAAEFLEAIHQLETVERALDSRLRYRLELFVPRQRNG